MHTAAATASPDIVPRTVPEMQFFNSGGSPGDLDETEKDKSAEVRMNQAQYMQFFNAGISQNQLRGADVGPEIPITSRPITMNELQLLAGGASFKA